MTSRRNVLPMRQPASLPHSDENERACLACILLRPEYVEQAGDLLSPAMFYSERHQLIFKAYLTIHRHDGEIDLTTLQSELEKSQVFETVGGVAYLAGLDLDLPDLGRFETYAAAVRERWARRELIERMATVNQKALDSAEETAHLIAEIQDSMLDLDRDSCPGGQYRPVGEVLIDLDPFTLKPSGMLGLPSGLKDLDRYTLGFQPGQLIVIAGRPSMGKTSLAQKIAMHQALAGHQVGFVSLEDSEIRVGTKWLAQHTRIPYENLALGRITEVQKEKVMKAIRDLASSSLHLDDTPAQTVEQICSSARRLATQQGLEILYVDFINLARTMKRHENRNREIGAISEELKGLSKSLGIPVVVLCQLSRQPERRTDKMPQLDDLRESGELEQNADVVILCRRMEHYEPTNREHIGSADLAIAKNKDGPTGRILVAFDGPTMSFADLDRHEEPPKWEQQW